VRAAVEADTSELARVLARAFHDDPFHRWIFPTEEAWKRGSPRLFAILFRQALRHGVVTTTERVQGAAVWTPPRPADVPLWERFWLAARFAWVIGRRASLIQRGFERVEQARPSEPHWHLSVLGTDPRQRGRGVGSALLRAGLDRCDAEGIRVYLESSKRTNIPFYELHGFRVVGELAVPEGPTLWPMSREPRQ
jgi:ribosomal protein S18 acetylase RimI-like enzyme